MYIKVRNAVLVLNNYNNFFRIIIINKKKYFRKMTTGNFFIRGRGWGRGLKPPTSRAYDGTKRVHLPCDTTPSSSSACHMPTTSCRLNESWSVDTRFMSQSMSSLPDAHRRTTERPPPVFRSLSTVFWSLRSSVRSTQPALAIDMLGLCARQTRALQNGAVAAGATVPPPRKLGAAVHSATRAYTGWSD